MVVKTGKNAVRTITTYDNLWHRFDYKFVPHLRS